jgi:biopolymer transport protein ExbB
MVENPYGLEALWKGGDIVAKITLAILAIMSMGSWYIIITKVYEQYKMGKHARAADKTFWKAPSVREGAEGPQEGEPVPLHRPRPASKRRASMRACSKTST